MRRGWAVICDRCGFKFKSYQLREDWQGLRVCSSCFETRHPQDFVRGVPDDPSVPWTRPEGADVFVPVCTIVTSSAYPSLGVAGCMIAGNNAQSYAFLLDFADLPPVYPEASPPVYIFTWDEGIFWDGSVFWDTTTGIYWDGSTDWDNGAIWI